MRIAHLLSPSGSAAADEGLRLARAFADLGHEVVGLTIGPEPPDGHDGLDIRAISLDPFDARAIQLLETDVSGEPEIIRAMRTLLEGAALRERAGAALAGFDPELVYEATAPFTAAGVALGREFGAPVVLEASETAAVAQPLATAADELERLALDAADHVVVPSDRVRARLVSAGVPEGKLAVIPPAVDADGFELTAPVRDALRSLLRVADRLTVGVIADLDAERDVRTVIQAVAELGRRGTGVTLLLIGDGPERAAAQESIDASNEITALMPGAVPEEQIPAYLAAIDVAVAPSASGAEFPARRLFQYLAGGVPVVAANTPGIAHCIHAGETGLTYSPGDPDVLAEALEGLLRDPDRARVLGEAGREHIVHAHSWAERARTILTLATPPAEVQPPREDRHTPDRGLVSAHDF